MPLTKVNGEYRTPGGCSAWNGRCFATAHHDFKCDIAYIVFTRGGWYRRKQTPFWVMRDWWEGNEDPGCEWNSTRGAEWRASWGRYFTREGEEPMYDYTFDQLTLMFVPTHRRPMEDWFTACQTEDEE